MTLNDLRTLGRSGLAVSPLTLGTMTMGNTDWGSPDADAAAIFNAYVDAGGNAIDTADGYAGGRSEELVGRFIAERRLRDRVVLATKYGFGAEWGNPLAGGSGRKNLGRAIDGSLRRLGTDYLDLYWLHVWDGMTPAEEVLGALGDQVRAGKIRYFGLSDVPAWFTTRLATLAQAYAVPSPIALQMSYSLIDRHLELEHRPAARELGLGLVPWSPLGAGLLTGKYDRDAERSPDQGRLGGANPFGDSLFTDRNFDIVDVVRSVAGELDRSPGQVALAWLAGRPGVATTIIGARTTDQLTDNLAALEVTLTADQRDRLDVASAIELPLPYNLFAGDMMAQAVTNGTPVRGWSEQ